MRVVQGLDGLRSLSPGAVVSIGNFDGLHLGHQRILALGGQMRRRHGGELAVVTFEPHPLTRLRPQLAPPRLTPPDAKRDRLRAMGIDTLVELPPTDDVLNLAAEDFWHILRDEARVAHLVEGTSFNFGKGRAGTIARLAQWASTSDVRLHIVDPVTVTLRDLWVVAVSSSLIRWLLANGRVRDAAICLGRPYELVGTVVPGHQRGRNLGVPTANLRCDQQLVPMEGVYASRCRIDGRNYPVALSIGTMPTFGPNAAQIEAHVLGYAGDLYGTDLHVEVLDWIREQRKFPSPDALKSRIARDMEEIAALQP